MVENAAQGTGNILEALASPDPGMGGYSKEALVQHLLQTRTESEDARKLKKHDWDAAWDAYNNNFDFSDKAKWQSKGFLPKFKMAVRTASYIFKQSLTGKGPVFTTIGLNDESHDLEKDVQDPLVKALKQASYTERLGVAIHAGLIENHCNLKMYPVPLGPDDYRFHPEQTIKLKLVPVSSYDIWLDPTGRNRYLIHMVKMDLADFKELAKAGVYDASVAEKIEEDFKVAEEEWKKLRREDLITTGGAPWRKEVALYEYWGDVDDETGKRRLKNVTYTVVNDKYLARAPKKNPFRRWPFVVSPIVHTPFTTYNEGYGDSAVPIAKMINEAYNTVNDQNSAASLNAFFINLDLLSKPSQLKRGVFPGATFFGRGVIPGQKPIETFQVGELKQESLLILGQYDREFQSATGLNEWVAAAMGAGSKTATESKLKSSQASGLMSEMALDIQDKLVRQTVENAYYLFLDYNPEVFGNRINSVAKDNLQFRFDVRVITEHLQNQDELQKALMFLNVMGQTPLAQRINWNALGEKIIRALGWEASEVLIPAQAQPALPGQGPTTSQEVAAGAAPDLSVLMGRRG